MQHHLAWPQLLQTLRRHIPFFDTRQFGSALWACDKLHLVDEALLPELLFGATELLMHRPGTWQMRQLSACMVGLAGLQL